MNSEELKHLVAAAIKRFEALTPEEQAREREAQRQSFVRSMMPYGHDMTLDQLDAEIVVVEGQIRESTCPGAYLNQLHENLDDLRLQRKRILREQSFRSL